MHYARFSLAVLLLFIQVIRGLYQSVLWEESWIVWRGVTWVAIVPVVWLYCFFPFPCLPPKHFPKTKEYKTANAFTTHWRRQGELCRLHYLFTVETGISLNETAVSIPPWSHCGGLQSQLLLYHYLSLFHSPPPAAFITAPRYRETLALPPWTPCRGWSFSWAGWKQKIQHWQQQHIRGCAASLGFCIMMTFKPQAKLADFEGMGARSEPEMVEPQHRHMVSSNTWGCLKCCFQSVITMEI